MAVRPRGHNRVVTDGFRKGSTHPTGYPTVTSSHPDKRTFSTPIGMSQRYQKATSSRLDASARVMLTPLDICFAATRRPDVADVFGQDDA
jgi:hypothetical protein